MGPFDSHDHGVGAGARYEIDQALARIGRAAPVIREFRIVRLSD